MFTARYAQIPYITYISFVFKRLRGSVTYPIRAFSLRVSESAILNISSQLLIDNEQRNFTHISKIFRGPEF